MKRIIFNKYKQILKKEIKYASPMENQPSIVSCKHVPVEGVDKGDVRGLSET